MKPPRYFLHLRNQNQSERRGRYRTLEAAKRVRVRIQQRKINGHFQQNHSFTS